MVDGPLTEEEINELLAAYEELIVKIKEGKVRTLTRLPIREEVGNCGSKVEKVLRLHPMLRR
ncbi:hypothetical protein MOMUL_24570 [Moorella mulderi DSM 14980]|uniref:Uncharacterized protein n=1 Tax=Moorella mulderi DSM 14980 TaxID=1122241 RepID=A0A151AUZ5_9FIRM|nr:hypothetical protein MOMUL_24570 [Moorella mulderi DSM 14980]